MTALIRKEEISISLKIVASSKFSTENSYVSGKIIHSFIHVNCFPENSLGYLRFYAKFW